MGSMQAAGMAELVDEGRVDLDTVLRWHLTSNHFPPLPVELAGPAREAIEAIEAGDYDRAIRLPAGVTWRNRRSAPARECAEAWHLDSFIEEGA
jgi:hypothetical protein